MASSHPAIAKMLEHYALNSKEESVDALREILQEIVLLGLYEGGFFKEAAFYGGTALRNKLSISLYIPLFIGF